MRIGCLQFAPQVGDVNNNLNRADAVLSKSGPEDLDLLVLPELAFSGYNFRSLQDISPFLEPQGSGISALWARTNALKHECAVVVGYPEKADVSWKWPTGPEYYNSAIVVSREGHTALNYRKTHLYYTDEPWALEGPHGFFSGQIPDLGLTVVGICMDINPYKFEAPWTEYEFANHVLTSGANLVIISMAWLTREEAREFSRMPDEPDMETLHYWISRLEPIIRADIEDEIIIVFANRTGVEEDAVYAGTSSVIGIKNGVVNVYGMLGRGSKELLVVDTDATPYGQLVFRPDGNGVSIGTGEPGSGEPPEHGSLYPVPNDEQDPSSSQAGLAQDLPAQVAPPQEPAEFQDGPPAVNAQLTQSQELPASAVRRPNLPMAPKLSIPVTDSKASSNSILSPVLDTPTCPSPTPIAPRSNASFSDYSQRFFVTNPPAPLSSVEEAPENVENTENTGSVAGTPLDSCTPISDLSSAVSEAPAGLFWVDPGPSKHEPPTPSWVTRQPDFDDEDESASVVSFQTDSSALSGFTGGSHYNQAGYVLGTQNPQKDEAYIASWRTNALSVLATPYRANVAATNNDGPTPRAFEFSKSRAVDEPPNQSDSGPSQESGAEGLGLKLGSIVGSVGDSEPTMRGPSHAKKAELPERPSSTKSLNVSEKERRHRSTSRTSDHASRNCVKSTLNSQDQPSSAIGRLQHMDSAENLGGRHDAYVGPDYALSGSVEDWDARDSHAQADLQQVQDLATIDTSAIGLPSHDRPVSRNSSRGRQRVASWIAKEQELLQRSSSADQPSRSRSAAASGLDLSQFRYIEEYPNKNCPVHGSRPSTSVGHRSEHSNASREWRPQTQGSMTRGKSPSKNTYKNRSEAGFRPQTKENPSESRRKDSIHRSKTIAPDFSASVETLVTTNESPRQYPLTPPNGPLTPKAMILVFDDDEEEAGDLNKREGENGQSKEKQLKCYDRDAGPDISRPRSAMM